MKNYDFDWQINEFMVYCRSTQLRERTMYSYEQTLRLFERWLCDELKIYSAGSFSFWEAKLTVIKGAVKYPQGFSIEDKRKNGKPWGSIAF